MIFVRDGVIAPAGADGQPLPDGRVLVATDWSLGDTLTVGGAEGTAPVQASCVGLFSEDLGDVQRLVAMGGEPPDTDLAWSPDGARLAVGSHTGEVLVLDGWTGTVLARKRLAETMVKHVVWSLDGATLHAAEQSPDANVMAIDQGTTGTTVLILDPKLNVLGKGYSEFPQIYPQPGWVEHDLDAIWESTVSSVGRALSAAGVGADSIGAIGMPATLL